MGNNKEYKCISTDNLEKLNNDVNDLLKQGWELLGGVSISTDSYDDEYGTKIQIYCAQALTRDSSIRTV